MPVDLQSAMRAYSEAAMNLLREACPDDRPTQHGGVDEWRRDSDGVFRLYDQEEPAWVDCLRRHHDRLHAVDQYHKLLDALRTTPYASEIMDQLVGSVYSRHRIDSSQIADQIIWRMARAGGLDFADDRFVQAFEVLEADLRRRQLSYVWLVPLLGATAETAPIPLEPDLEIERMSDEEIIRCLRLGMLPSDPSGLTRMRTKTSVPEFALRFRYKEPLRIGEVSEEDQKRVFARDSAIRDRLLAVLAALRVFKAGRISIPGVLNFCDDWPMRGATQFTFANPGLMPSFNRYELSAAEAIEFQAFWGKVESLYGTGALANAIRRFSYASERERPDDALVDYMIAAESLFLSEINQPDRGEMRYRLALRAAVFIDLPEYAKRQIFQYVRRAYDARSVIVHGVGPLDPKELKSPTGDVLSLDEFTRFTENFMRRALLKAVPLSKPGGGLGIDWDALVFP